MQSIWGLLSSLWKSTESLHNCTSPLQMIKAKILIRLLSGVSLSKSVKRELVKQIQEKKNNTGSYHTRQNYRVSPFTNVNSLHKTVYKRKSI